MTCTSTNGVDRGGERSHRCTGYQYEVHAVVRNARECCGRSLVAILMENRSGWFGNLVHAERLDGSEPAP